MAKIYGDMSPEDFPQVWQRPPFEELLACLKQLHVEPPVWNPSAPKKALQDNQENTARHRRDVMSYLASIVSNSLQWIKDDDHKEIIWEEASRCLSQRCGRAGMGEITRKWPFQNRAIPFELVIREPPITGDSLGHKTWGSSFLMAQLIDGLTTGSLAHLLASGRRESVRVLELGSGTGLLGIAAAAMWQANVILSDLPDIMPNLDHNIEQNRATVERLGGKVSSGTLTWGCETKNGTIFSHENQFNVGGNPSVVFYANKSQVILVADGIYDDDHPALLSLAIHRQLLDNLESRAVVMVPIRDQIAKGLITQFRSYMSDSALSLVVLEEHILTGQDDWGDDDDETRAVQCWWAIFGKQLL